MKKARKGDKTPSIARIFNNWFSFNQLVWKGEEFYQQDKGPLSLTFVLFLVCTNAQFK